MPKKHLKSDSAIVWPDPQQELVDSLARLLKEPKYSDLTIICHSHTFLVHKSIVCPRSNFFAKACDGNFQEAASEEITLDEEPLLVKKMVEYLYMLDYQIDDVQNSEVETPVEKETTPIIETSDKPSAMASTQYYDPVSFHILMYSLADRLIIHGLKSLSKMKVKQELRQSLFEKDALRKAVIETYNTTPEHERGLRDLIVDITTDHLSELRRETSSAPVPLQDSLFKEVPDYAYDLLRTMIKKNVKRSYGSW